MGQLIVFFVFAIAAAGLGVYAVRADKQMRARALALATERGYQIDISDKPPPPLGFDLFELGSSRRLSLQIWRAGSNDCAFQYRYTTGSGKNRTTHRRSCAMVEVPFNAPHLEIGPEGFWSAIGRAVGMRDIEIESPTFNERYRVSCPDERFAITLLDPAMIAWMLSPHSGGGTVKFELWGRWMLCWGDQVEFDRLFGYLEWAQSARSHLPAVLASLYPAA